MEAMLLGAYSYGQDIPLIPENTDLNDYFKEGMSKSGGSAATRILQNLPLSNIEYSVYVVNVRLTPNTFGWQYLFTIDAGTFVRSHNNGTWSPWSRFDNYGTTSLSGLASALGVPKSLYRIAGNGNTVYQVLPILSPYHTEIIEITSYINSGYNPYKTILFVGRQANITNSNTQRKDIVASSNNNLKIYTDGETIYIVPYGSSGGANVYLSTSAIFTPVVVTKDVSALTELTTVIS